MYLIIGNRLNWNFNEMFTFDLLSFGLALKVFILYVTYVFNNYDKNEVNP